MIRTFGTWEEAALYSSFMRSEGYFSALLDECSAPLYGPPAIGGIRVILSDEPITQPADILDEHSHEWETPPPSQSDGELAMFIRITAVSLVAFGLVILAFFLFQAAHNVPGGLVGIFLLSLAYPALMCLIFLALIPGLCFITNSLRKFQKQGAEGWLFWFVMFLLFSWFLF